MALPMSYISVGRDFILQRLCQQTILNYKNKIIINLHATFPEHSYFAKHISAVSLVFNFKVLIRMGKASYNCWKCRHMVHLVTSLIFKEEEVLASWRNCQMGGRPCKLPWYWLRSFQLRDEKPCTLVEEPGSLQCRCSGTSL